MSCCRIALVCVTKLRSILRLSWIHLTVNSLNKRIMELRHFLQVKEKCELTSASQSLVHVWYKPICFLKPLVLFRLMWGLEPMGTTYSRMGCQPTAGHIQVYWQCGNSNLPQYEFGMRGRSQSMQRKPHNDSGRTYTHMEPWLRLESWSQWWEATVLSTPPSCIT